MNDLPLFAHARRTDPAVSHEAARSVNTCESYKRILNVFRSRGLLTDEQLVEVRAIKDHMSPSRARTARNKLAEAGYLEIKKMATTTRGRRCRVWGLK